MTLDYCVACYGLNKRDGEGETARTARSAHFLCNHCWDKVRRDGRSVRHVVEAVLLYYDDSFGKSRCPCDEEDLRDLELLGLWPDEVTVEPVQVGRSNR